VFGDLLPPEALVADMLGLTQTEVRSLLPRVIARYRKRLAGVLEESAKKTLKTAKGPLSNGDWFVVCDPVTSRFLKDRLADIVETGAAEAASAGGLLSPLAPDRGTVNGYTLTKETFEALNESLQLPKRAAKSKK